MRVRKKSTKLGANAIMVCMELVLFCLGMGGSCLSRNTLCAINQVSIQECNSHVGTCSLPFSHQAPHIGFVQSFPVAIRAYCGSVATGLTKLLSIINNVPHIPILIVDLPRHVTKDFSEEDTSRHFHSSSLMSGLTRRCFENQCRDPLEAVASGVLSPGKCTSDRMVEALAISN